MQDANSKDSDSLLGQSVPRLIAPATNNFDIHFDRLKGYQTIVFFYPQNGLPGVTQVAKDFAEHYGSFKQIKTCVFGVSTESLESNQSFKDQLELPFQLISDAEADLSKWFATLTERTIFGDPIKTLEQSTFLIDADGKVAYIWRNPEVRGHVAEVIELAHKLSEGLPLVAPLPHIDVEAPVLENSEDHEALTADLAELFEVE